MTEISRPTLPAKVTDAAIGSDTIAPSAPDAATQKTVGRPVLRSVFSVDSVDEGEMQKGSGEWAPNPTGIDELLKGSLPKAQLELLAGSGYNDFVLGTNQSGVGSVEECRRYLDSRGGVDFTGYGIGNRFMTFDSGYVGLPEESYIRDSVVNGYYGHDGQPEKRGGLRIVGVFPFIDGARQRWGQHASQVIEMVYLNGDIPDDLVHYGGASSTGRTEQAVSPKYIAGLVDDNGNYFLNPGFMQEPASPDTIGVGR